MPCYSVTMCPLCANCSTWPLHQICDYTRVACKSFHHHYHHRSPSSPSSSSSTLCKLNRTKADILLLRRRFKADCYLRLKLLSFICLLCQFQLGWVAEWLCRALRVIMRHQPTSPNCFILQNIFFSQWMSDSVVFILMLLTAMFRSVRPPWYNLLCSVHVFLG